MKKILSVFNKKKLLFNVKNAIYLNVFSKKFNLLEIDNIDINYIYLHV